jgi:hypothetical protein
MKTILDSLYIDGNVSANTFIGSGSQLTGIPQHAVLTGFTATSGGTVLATDTIQSSIQKLEYKITNLPSFQLERYSVSVPTSSVEVSLPTVVLAHQTLTVNMNASTWQLLSVSADAPCRFRIYGTLAAANTDATRNAQTEPFGNHGMYAEIILRAYQLSWVVSPVVVCVNEDTVKTQNIYITVENYGIVPTAINITLNILKME